MAIRRAHSTVGGQRGFDYISQVGILNGSGATVPLNRAQVAAWIDNNRDSFYVQGGDGSPPEVVVEEH